MDCKECQEIGNKVIDLFMSEGYTVDEAKIVLHNVLDSINEIIGRRQEVNQ